MESRSFHAQVHWRPSVPTDLDRAQVYTIEQGKDWRWEETRDLGEELVQISNPSAGSRDERGQDINVTLRESKQQTLGSDSDEEMRVDM